VLGITDLD